jgi:hypothetical protein
MTQSDKGGSPSVSGGGSCFSSLCANREDWFADGTQDGVSRRLSKRGSTKGVISV